MEKTANVPKRVKETPTQYTAEIARYKLLDKLKQNARQKEKQKQVITMVPNHSFI
jgi:hypothetical protein